MPEVYLSEEAKNDPLVLMQISCGNGDVCLLYIGEHDNSTELAKQFVQKLSLDESFTSRVEFQINERRMQALASRVVDESPKPPTRDLSQMSPAEAAFQAARNNWLSDSPVKGSGSSTSSSSQIPTNYRDLKYTSGPGKSAKKLPNQEAFDRMHNYSKHKDQRREQLRSRMEAERIKQLEDSTFKARGGHLRYSPSNYVRRRSTSAGRSRPTSAGEDEASAPSQNENSSNVFHDLYSTRYHYSDRARERWLQQQQEFEQRNYGIPQIAPKSHFLAMKRREARDQEIDKDLAYSKKTTPIEKAQPQPKYGTKGSSTPRSSSTPRPNSNSARSYNGPSETWNRMMTSELDEPTSSGHDYFSHSNAYQESPSWDRSHNALYSVGSRTTYEKYSPRLDGSPRSPEGSNLVPLGGTDSSSPRVLDKSRSADTLTGKQNSASSRSGEDSRLGRPLQDVGSQRDQASPSQQGTWSLRGLLSRSLSSRV